MKEVIAKEGGVLPFTTYKEEPNNDSGFGDHRRRASGKEVSLQAIILLSK